ncbi:MAG: hypothetical protein RLZZ420_994 [Bacteroidota bacterium]
MNNFFMHIRSFTSLIRIQNLVFIVFTQYFFYFFILIPIYSDSPGSIVLTLSVLHWLVLASVLIAGGGYVINDYFDLNIDRINKPQKLVIDRFISRRWAMFFHLILSFAGIVISAYIAYLLNNPLLLVFNLLSVFLLFVYSSTFKKKLLTGNVIIATLSAWVIMVLFVAMCQWNPGTLIPEWTSQLHEVYKIALVYSAFAFIVSLIREVVKDIEDEEGDKKNGCKTMPIVWGIKSTKVFIGVWILVLFGLLIVFLFNLIISRWLWGIFYIIFVLLPFLVRIYMAFSKALTKKHYAELSREVKLFMLAGILSMLIYYIYQ